MDLIQPIIDALLQTEYATYVLGFCFVCAAFTAIAPEKVTSKVPDFLMVIINAFALNVGQAKNLLTDMKGNKK